MRPTPTSENNGVFLHEPETTKQSRDLKQRRNSQVSLTSTSSHEQDAVIVSSKIPTLQNEQQQQHQEQQQQEQQQQQQQQQHQKTTTNSRRDGRQSFFLPQRPALGASRPSTSNRFSLRVRGGKDASPADRTPSCSRSSPCSESNFRDLQLKANAVLRRLRTSTSALSRQEEELERSVAVHRDRAVARYKTQNKVGALLSMRNFKRLDQKHQKIMDAIDTLEMQDIEMSSFILKLESAAAGAASILGDALPQATSFSELNMELSNYYNSFSKVEKELNGDAEQGHWNDEALLQELCAFL